MKKQYSKPSMIVVDVNVHGILCASPIQMSSESQDNNAALGRGGFFDEDEDY